MRYPRRHGPIHDLPDRTGGRDRVPSRFEVGKSRAQLATQRESELLETLDASDPWLALTLVPDLDGEYPINRASYTEFQQRLSKERPAMP